MDINVKYVDPAKLIPYIGNARVHNEQQIQDLCRSIQQFGFVSPVLVDKSGEIIAGHGRLLAASRIGMEQVPVIELSHLSPREVMALRLADNRIQLSSTWDFEKLSAELNALVELDVDLSLTGFDEQEIDALLKSDVAIFTGEHHPDMMSTEGSSRQDPTKSDGDLVQVERPKTTDDEYSTFELVMNHQNKVRLIQVLDDIKEVQGFSKMEDALMFLANNYSNLEE